MTELLPRNLARKIIELTPAHFRDRVSNSLLKLYEKRQYSDLDDHAFRWYQRHAHGTNDTTISFLPFPRMSLSERVWFLLESEPIDREPWIRLISGK